jgi:ABC-type nitrate/sulfonate/bicarbonate transport system substrate-binding protein
VLKAPGCEIFQDGVIPIHSQDIHAGVMFVYQIGEQWILLIIGEGDAEYLAFGGDVRDQCSTTQFNIIGVSADEEYPFSVE